MTKKSLSGWEYSPNNSGAPINPLTAWHYNDSVRPTVFPRWKSFASASLYRPYRIPDVQSNIDDAEPENFYNNADGDKTCDCSKCSTDKTIGKNVVMALGIGVALFMLYKIVK